MLTVASTYVAFDGSSLDRKRRSVRIGSYSARKIDKGLAILSSVVNDCFLIEIHHFEQYSHCVILT